MAGVNAFGTQVQRGDGGAPEVFTAVANIPNVEGPETERETIDVTAHDSPDGWREYVGGLKDGGELTVEVNFVPVEHFHLYADFEDALPRNYKLVHPDGAIMAFAAVLTGLSTESPHDDKISGEITWQLSGKPTLTLP